MILSNVDKSRVIEIRKSEVHAGLVVFLNGEFKKYISYDKVIAYLNELENNNFSIDIF